MDLSHATQQYFFCKTQTLKVQALEWCWLTDLESLIENQNEFECLCCQRFMTSSWGCTALCDQPAFQLSAIPGPQQEVYQASFILCAPTPAPREVNYHPLQVPFYMSGCHWEGTYPSPLRTFWDHCKISFQVMACQVSSQCNDAFLPKLIWSHVGWWGGGPFLQRVGLLFSLNLWAHLLFSLLSGSVFKVVMGSPLVLTTC